MSVASILYDIVSETEDIAKTVGASSLDEDNRPPIPFAVTRRGGDNPGMGRMKRGSYTIYVHDDPGSYSRINCILSALDARLNGKEHLTDGEGNWVNSIVWTGTSGELFDTGFRTAMKSITFEVITSGD